MSADALPTPAQGAALAVLMAVILAVDALIPLWGQVIGAAMAWGIVGWHYQRVPRPAQMILMSCLVVGMLGEIFCSLIWQLYDYRLFNIPPYVPPGHVMMFLIGCSIAPRLSRHMIWLVPALVAPVAVAGYAQGFDEFGITLFIMFLACLAAERERSLYVTMFLICLALEIVGTWLGNWTWRPVVPIWGMSNTNPPVSAGVFYCLLDFLMLRLFLSWRHLSGVMPGALMEAPESAD